jgi:hypothetical protein
VQIGDLVANRFELRDLRGSGGMGAVYRAWDRDAEQTVALKVLTRDGAQDVARFAREAEVLRTLDHPRIVRYVAHGSTQSGELFLAMEWLDGEDLEARLARGRLTVPDALRVARGVAEALAAAHARGIVHRDIKPSNLILCGGDIDRVKVVDFGVARGAGLSTLSTSAGVLIGTPAYMAPEQLRASHGADARADVYSLGCVLFECLAGRPAFGGAHAIAVLAKILMEEVPRLADSVDDVPDAVDQLVAQMLSKDAALRPPDGAAALAMLLAIGDARALRRASPSLELPGLTRGEQQLLSVVLARAPRRPVDAQGPTLTDHAQADLATTERSAPADEALRRAVQPFKARVERLVDGSVVATIVGRGAATDQAARGARCALALRALLPGMAIALATGRGVVAGHLPVGDVIDGAAALVSDDAGTEDDRRVRLDDVTAGLLDERFEFTGNAKGLWLVGERTPLRATRHLLGKPTPCVGRDRELATMLGVFDECVAESAPRVLLVTGAPGVGKSRLRYEFLAKVSARDAPVDLLMSRGDPMSAGAALVMVVPLLRQAAGVVDGEPPDARRRKLAARVARNIETKECPRVTEFLAEVIGAPFQEEEGSALLRAARREAVVMGDQIKRAWEDFVAAENGARPVVIVLEDLHWGDASSVDFLDGMLRLSAERPLLILALARPEVKTMFPDLWAEHGVVHIELGALSRRASARLVRDVLGEGVGEDTVARIVEQADGNALYLEELIRAAAKGKVEAAPRTVLAMVQARLEALEPERRRVLRGASIFGETFWQGGVVALVGRGADRAPVEQHLARLVEDEVIAPREPSRFPLEREYIFRHALVREAAYAMLTDEDRRTGHRVAKAWLERVGEGDPMILAEHCERGGRPAAGYYLHGARQAFGGNDFGAVIARVERSIACGAQGEERGAARLLEVIANHWHGTVEECERCALDASEAFRQGDAGWFESMAWAVWAAGRLGHADRVDELVYRVCNVVPEPGAVGASLVALSRVVGHLVMSGTGYRQAVALMPLVEERARAAPSEPRYEAFLSRTRATIVSITTRDPSESIRHYTLAADAFDRAGDVRSACIERMNLGNVYVYLGANERAEQVLRDAQAAATRLVLRRMKAYALLSLGVIAARVGRMQEARTQVGAAVDEYGALGDPTYASIASSYLVCVLLAGGEIDAARAASRTVSAGTESEGVARVFALAAAASVHLARSESGPALERAREAMVRLDELGTVEDGEELTRLVYAEALRAAGEVDAWRRAIRRAKDALVDKAERIRDPKLRDGFLRIPENARTLALAEQASSDS